MLASLLFATSGSIWAQQESTVVKGYVLDSSCAFVKNLSKPSGKGCALKCARNGSVLVIITDDGTIYWPISDSTPAVGQNSRLMEFAGKKVTAKGEVFDKGGSHAIVIKQIEVASDFDRHIGEAHRIS
jgi:hypothetical protein